MAEDEENYLGAADHNFGGAWTEIKLDAVQRYLEMYAAALSPIFDLWYIDAFAGSGTRTVKTTAGGLLEGTPLEFVKRRLDGSAKRALQITPAFDHFLFIEADTEFHEALKGLKEQYPERDINCVHGDANNELKKVALSPWVKKKSGRGVVFLDPYSMHVDWETLVTLSKTEVLDIWYLFPIGAVSRQLAVDFTRIDKHKAAALDRVIGRHWRDLYKEHSFSMPSLFGEDIHISQTTRAKGRQRIENWVKAQLSQTFKYCSDPLPLLIGNGQQLFSLFLLVANPRKSAIDLAKRFSKDVIKKYS